MSSLPATLYALQKLELSVDKARARITEIDAALENDEVVVARKAKLETVQSDLHQTQADMKDIELEIQGLNQKIQEVTDLLYSGKIKNPKELTERQDEVESLKRRVKTLEARLLDIMTWIEGLKRDTAKAQKALDEALAERRQMNADLVIERQQLDDQIKKNLKKRKQTRQSISDDSYKAYRTLRKKKNGMAVAPLKGSSCGLCGVTQTTQSVQEIRQNDTMVYCSNCGRILVILS
jgi:predicted  nucleic acid-binding Zn-ribbon protein